MNNNVEPEISRLIAYFQQNQATDGSWRFCLENSPLTDAYMIILLRTLDVPDEQSIARLAARIASMQQPDGCWRLFPDETAGNLSITVESYYALLYAGYYQKTDPAMRAAFQYIRQNGGLSKTSMLTKVMLALTGQYPWPAASPPIELLLLPRFSPISFYDFVGYARVYLTPILIAADRKASFPTAHTPSMVDLYVDNGTDTDSLLGFFDTIRQGVKQLPFLPAQLHALALRKAERFMLARIEPDGTLYSYFGATFLMIFALMALGYRRDHPVITRAVTGLYGLFCQANGQLMMQNNTSTVWDTALASHALLNAGLPANDPMMRKSADYLLARQQQKASDWSWNNPGVAPGGWGFSDINTLNPDVDDTTTSLRAMRRMMQVDRRYRSAWDRGLTWILSMQNDDGGWPAFEKNTDKAIMRSLPIEGAAAAATDPSTADLTGRTLEFLGNDTGFTLASPAIGRPVSWLLRQQEKDGSWYGRWGITYLYGTWAALTGMCAVGLPADHPAVQKAVAWLTRVQNADGGWGESCKSDVLKTYVPLGISTLSQTAWATDALIAASPKSTPAIERGIRFLIQSGTKSDWTTNYPTGAGLPGGFYFQYDSYQKIWPLLALGNYRNKYA
ncbi:squalene--hopene cyclase [Brevibacillus fluminis]|uniref:Squalene--hopene cyclase n=1 Tax=Brevibacillus fluminis TaxID=511487 RepID=A0A3M8DK33_9BACL|nr:squalene--hopene cyclase [Brevibacillus fluminis]RNB87755.1 squalene--hopene cyclase [Brevibacillus fluminis]